MKIIYLIYLIFTLEIISCIELTGIKFEVNEEMANAALYHFYPYINNYIKDMPIDDIHVSRGINIRDIKAGISNFTPDKVKFTFKESGINIKITDLKAHIFIRAYISKFIVSFTKHATADINSFSLDANIRVTSKIVNGSLYPDAEFIETPKHDIDLDVNIGGVLSILESYAQDELKKGINNFFENESNKFLKLALEQIPIVIPIDKSKGYSIDYSLVNPIRMKNGYLEVNSYALLFNENINDTKKKKRIALSYVPEMVKIDKQYQLFISQYSINSALFTFFRTDPLSLNLDSKIVNSALLSLILPGINQKYGNDNVIIYFNTRKEGELELNKDGVIGKIYGKIIIKLKGTGEVIFKCDVDLTTNVEIIVKNSISITGNIHSLNIKVGNIDENKSSSEILIEKNINAVTSAVLPLANEIIENGVNFTLPVFFKGIKIEHNKQYIKITYTLRKELLFEELNKVFNNILAYLEKSFLEENNYVLTDNINAIYNEIGNFIATYLRDNRKLKTQVYSIALAFRKIAENINNQNEVRNYLSQLNKSILDINKYVNVNDLGQLYDQISTFVWKNIEMTKNPNKGNQSVSNQLKQQLKFIANGIICRAQNIMAKLVNSGNNYFILYDKEYAECLKEKNI